MKSLSALVLACMAGAALAACPNKCSGHGSCSSLDKCTCEPHYTGADCSGRTCTYGLSWTAEMDDGDIIPAGRGLGGYHAYTECSSKGKCNRGSGLCECYDGFTGSGCRRTTCPGDCSGHGRCLTLRQANASYVAYHAAQFASQYWNANMTRVCDCDGGWEGRDCGSRICPKGDDPLTDCTTDSTTFQGATHEQIQRIYVVHKSSTHRNCKDSGASKSTSLAATRPPGYAVYGSCYYGEIYQRGEGRVTGSNTDSTTGITTGITTSTIQIASAAKAQTKVPYVTVFPFAADDDNLIPRTFATKTPTAVSGAMTGAKVLANADTAPNDYYNGWEIEITSGPGNGQTKTITGYATNTKVVTVPADFSPVTGAGSQYTLTRSGGYSAVSGVVFPDPAGNAVVGTATTDADGIAIDGAYNVVNNGYIIHELPGLAGEANQKVMCPKSGPYSYQDQTDGKYPTITGTSGSDPSGADTYKNLGCEPEATSVNVGGKQMGYIALTYTDMYGSKYTTRPILIDSTVASTQDATSAGYALQYGNTETDGLPKTMMEYNTCGSSILGCRGPQLAGGGTNVFTAVTCTSNTCGGDNSEPGGAHPHWEGPVDRNADAHGKVSVSLVALVVGTKATPVNLRALSSNQETRLKLADCGATCTTHFPANYFKDAYITFTTAGREGTYRITASTVSGQDVEITTYEYVSGVNRHGATLGASTSAYYITTHADSGNYDTWRTPNRLLYTADRIRQALQELPNFAIPTVNVTNHRRLDTDAYMGNVFDVTFTDAGTSGQQELLECIYNTAYSNPGAWPKMANDATTDTTIESCVVQDIYMGTKQYEENVECSNRGSCDSSSGTCTCFEGFTGEACSEPTIFL